MWSKIGNIFSRKRKGSTEYNRIQIGGTEKAAKDKHSPFQLFALTYFYATGLEQNKLMETDPNKRIRMGIADFVNVTPKAFLPENVDQIKNELQGLQRELLLNDVAEKWFLTRTHGQLYVKKNLDQLVSKIHDPREYEGIIDNTETSGEVKNFIRQLIDKFKGQTQDEIVKTVIEGAQNTGLLFISPSQNSYSPVNLHRQ